MLSKGIMRESKTVKSCKQFRTCTGSPIIYAKFKKARGIYFPLAKPHVCSRDTKNGKKRKKNCCIVYSRTYGREVFGNINIWPDGPEKEKLVQISECGCGARVPAECECEEREDASSLEELVKDYSADNKHDLCPDDVTSPEVPGGGKHVTITVTDTSALDSPDSIDRQIHPALDRPNSPSSSEGAWPPKRSQSVDSRENPFLPGGDLSREADDILARAKIIRDTFLLDDNNKREPEIAPERARETKCESTNHREAEQTPVNETFTPEKAPNAETSPPIADTRPKENGQIDTDDSLSPGSVKMDLIDDTKDKKKHKKCCSVM